MQVQITGKNLDIGDSLRDQIEGRLVQDVGKYFDGSADGHVTIAKERNAFTADCTVHLSTGITLQSHGAADDPYACFELAADKLEKRLRRYKRRLKDHHNKRSEPVATMDAPRYVIAASDETATEPADLNPAIIAENTTRIQELSVGEAVMQLDISDAQFLFFRNGGHGGLNVVYRRDDGNIGWIDPGI